MKFSKKQKLNTNNHNKPILKLELQNPDFLS